MFSAQMLRQLYEYNYWARDRQLEVCRKLSDEQFTRAVGGSFASLRDTLAHVAWAEWIWCERWNGRSPRTASNPGQFANLGALEEYWRGVEREVRAFVSSISDAKLAQPLTYTNLAGVQWTYPLGDAMFHLMNHGTYHRGQVTMLLRQLGAKPVEVDYLVMSDARAAAAR